MTFREFIAAHNHQYLDYDGVYGAQCVDLIDFYCRDVLNIPIVWANAIDWYGKDATFLDWTPNDPNNLNQFPPPEAIVVWDKNLVVGTGVNGHIDIAVSGDGKSFIGFDQNWPPGSPCHLQAHTYDGVIGWGTKISPKAVLTMWQIEQIGDDNVKVTAISDVAEVTDKDGNKSVHVVAVGTDNHPWHFWQGV